MNNTLGKIRAVQLINPIEIAVSTEKRGVIYFNARDLSCFSFHQGGHKSNGVHHRSEAALRRYLLEEASAKLGSICGMF